MRKYAALLTSASAPLKQADQSLAKFQKTILSWLGGGTVVSFLGASLLKSPLILGVGTTLGVLSVVAGIGGKWLAAQGKDPRDLSFDDIRGKLETSLRALDAPLACCRIDGHQDKVFHRPDSIDETEEVQPQLQA